MLVGVSSTFAAVVLDMVPISRSLKLLYNEQEVQTWISAVSPGDSLIKCATRGAPHSAVASAIKCSTRQLPLDVRSSTVYLMRALWPLGGSSAPGFPPPRSSKQQTELRSKRGERTSETASDRDF